MLNFSGALEHARQYQQFKLEGRIGFLAAFLFIVEIAGFVAIPASLWDYSAGALGQKPGVYVSCILFAGFAYFIVTLRNTAAQAAVKFHERGMFREARNTNIFVFTASLIGFASVYHFAGNAYLSYVERNIVNSSPVLAAQDAVKNRQAELDRLLAANSEHNLSALKLAAAQSENEKRRADELKAGADSAYKAQLNAVNQRMNAFLSGTAYNVNGSAVGSVAAFIDGNCTQVSSAHTAMYKKYLPDCRAISDSYPEGPDYSSAQSVEKKITELRALAGINNAIENARAELAAAESALLSAQSQNGVTSADVFEIYGTVAGALHYLSFGIVPPKICGLLFFAVICLIPIAGSIILSKFAGVAGMKRQYIRHESAPTAAAAVSGKRHYKEEEPDDFEQAPVYAQKKPPLFVDTERKAEKVKPDTSYSNIIRLKAELGTQSAVAAHLGVNPSTITRIIQKGE